MSLDEMMLTSEEIKPVALSIVELCLQLKASVIYIWLVSQLAENRKILKSYTWKGLGLI